ncbi:DNA-binding transcriptional regulator, PucR family [Alteribacillus persepolensis]|uniref:DNA-binding transcriptional regulator, PucR family n=1 Tax=Alteribacillus persepolensis TaxID=568899 RepID=A0A1G8A7L0_9BACI|nr:helix-turn-helix domain-containing protein [Alteribacillus persepolensis]SDH16975.1 DNA-binding transcriptional regulator, PucR family [Alteribacillus persepolensis]
MVNKREKVMKKVEDHLRMTSRQLVQFDTEEEALQYLTDSFQSELSCDFVSVILIENENLIPKVWSGELQWLKESFPLPIHACYEGLFQSSLTYKDIDKGESCAFLDLLNRDKVKTWFTVPLQDESNIYGFCAIGYLEEIPLLQMSNIFTEFGRDVAVALTLAKQKESERKKMWGMEWMNQNILLDESVESLVSKLVERTGKGTQAQFAGIYLFNDKENCFTFQPPAYGKLTKPMYINVKENYEMKEYFPYIETPGGDELTVPMVLDVKTIGVLHVEQKRMGNVFTKEDREILELMANHVASTLENIRLYNNEKNHKKKLHELLNYQQKLIIETVEKDNFDGITSTLSAIFAEPVVLFDRFMRPMSFDDTFGDIHIDTIARAAVEEVSQLQQQDTAFMLTVCKETNVSFWPINGGGDLLGYLAVCVNQKEFDDFDRLTVDLVRNIYSIQFIKQKLVLDAKEQVKDSFINKLLVTSIENKESIIQYANIFQWDPFKHHRVAVLSVDVKHPGHTDEDILAAQATKSLMMDQLKTRIMMNEKDILLATKGDDYVLIVPAEKEENTLQYWKAFKKNIDRWLKTGRADGRAYLGIGSMAEKIEDYYGCYQEAMQALHVVKQRDTENGCAFFEKLGSYTLLHHIKDIEAASLFIKKQLSPLLSYSDGKSMDLFETLRIYLQHNGSIKKTSEALYIHRSSLLYRLEKIQQLLQIDINDSQNRFDLMLAYKLYELSSANEGQLE